MLCPACGRSHAGECDKMGLLKNELEYQRQVRNGETAEAALEWSIAEIERLRAALQRLAEYGGVDKPGGATITLSAATALQMRVMARAALEA